MTWNNICDCCGMSRRDFLKLSALFSTSLGVTLATSGCQSYPTATNSTPTASKVTTSPASTGGSDQPVKIGYLPITDASPLLIAHARKLYEAEGLTVEQPRLFRSWAVSF